MIPCGRFLLLTHFSHFSLQIPLSLGSAKLYLSVFTWLDPKMDYIQDYFKSQPQVLRDGQGCVKCGDFAQLEVVRLPELDRTGRHIFLFSAFIHSTHKASDWYLVNMKATTTEVLEIVCVFPD